MGVEEMVAIFLYILSHDTKKIKELNYILEGVGRQSQGILI